ncbi:polyprenyl synthetase family protein [Streptomyces sp. NPDC002055]|uniref:polyprenyl synthetase family protein n=1 Tax=Streptomyces sp. NPDC002055 TaxID=3154534 RepID=UPI003321F63C
MSVLDDLTTDHLPLRARVDAFLDAFLQERIEAEPDQETREALAELREFALRGGKRIRPLFCYWGWRGAGGAPDDPGVVAAAAALELFHTAALIHDDLIDRSDLRRGRPTMHVAMSRRHRSAGWRGDSGHFGLSSALLAGDACLVWSEEIFHDSPLVQRSKPARALFARLRSSAVYGEFLDLVGEARGGALQDALKIVRHKTASYTVRYPLQIGGALAGADEAVLAAYDYFGLRVGEAFQLRDDLVGFLGSPEQSGKNAADDARQGKPTALIAVARELAGEDQSARLRDLYGASWIGDEEVAELRDLVASTGAPAVVERMISDRYAEGVARLRTAAVHESALTELEQLATASLNRTC